jgi:uncharacterized protein YigE (DUF2233 family)
MRDFWALLLAGLFSCLSFGAYAAEPVCESRRFESSHFTVCLFDSRRDELRLAWTGPDGAALRNFERLKTTLGRDATRVRFAMNAGMYAENGNPIGLYVENGKVRRPLNQGDGKGNFYMKPNGVFSLDADGMVHVEPSDVFAARHAQPSFASQSGPVLVTNNALHPGISADGPSQYIRNGVGIRDAHTAIFVTSDDPVSFGKLARFLRDGLKCRDALYFDGAVSSAWIPTQHRMTQAAPLGPMVVVMGRR